MYKYKNKLTVKKGMKRYVARRKLSKQEIESKKEALKFYKGASDEEVSVINNSTDDLKKQRRKKIRK